MNGLFIAFVGLLCSDVTPHVTPPTQQAAAILWDGLGSHKHPVGTSNAEAQRFFNQGLTLIYAFNHDEAAKSFRRAAELDPKLAMAWWGVALALGPNYNMKEVDPEQAKTAYDALQKAFSFPKTHPSPSAITSKHWPRAIRPIRRPDGKKL